MHSRPRVYSKVPGFTLVELLVVMAIIVIMASLAGPALNAIKGGGDLTKTTSDISDLLQQARAYAMANNTYVYFGIAEVDSMKNSITEGAGGKGRLEVAIIASKTGSRPYTGNTLKAIPDDANAIAPINRLQSFDSAHIGTSADMSAVGGMADRQTGAPPKVVDVGSSQAVTTFGWLVGKSATTFSKVIEFDPQGVARFPDATLTANPNRTQGWIELPLLPSKGNTGPAANEKNMASIQVDGITGAVRVYRP